MAVKLQYAGVDPDLLPFLDALAELLAADEERRRENSRASEVLTENQRENNE